MHFGMTTMNNASGLRPAELAKLLEERGFESLWIGEHNHLPATGKTPYPATGGEPPEPYRGMMDLIASIAVAAQATTTLKIGSGVMLVLERNILSCAKEIATLDVLSGGRVEIGVGVGWNPEELENIAPNISWRQRYRALEECIAALRVLWSEDKAEFHGEFFDFPAVYSYPKPETKPHPPLWFGGTGRIGLGHVARWADGWFPIDMGERDFGVKMKWLDAALEAAGREPGSVPVSVMVWPGNTPNIERYLELGVHRVVVGLSNDEPQGPDDMKRFIDDQAAIIERLR
jgi:probable F420-dependent oxidoreductase